MEILFRCRDANHPLSEEEATSVAEGLHAYHPEGDHEPDVARKIEERVIGAKAHRVVSTGRRDP